MIPSDSVPPDLRNAIETWIGISWSKSSLAVASLETTFETLTVDPPNDIEIMRITGDTIDRLNEYMSELALSLSVKSLISKRKYKSLYKRLAESLTKVRIELEGIRYDAKSRISKHAMTRFCTMDTERTCAQLSVIRMSLSGRPVTSIEFDE